MARVDRAVRIIKESEGGSGIVTAERPHRQAREIVRLLLGEVAALGGHVHELAEHPPETLQVPSLEDRVDCLHAGDERLADLVGHTSASLRPDFPVWSEPARLMKRDGLPEGVAG